MREMKLFFDQDQLFEVIFTDRASGLHCHCVRGKGAGAHHSAGSFQWTAAVKGLALLLVRAASGLDPHVIHGYAGSLASSLDYAISKQPVWISDMFGFDAAGTCLVRRLVLRTNPERKRPGPTVLSVNERFIPLTAIAIFVNDRPLSREELVALATRLSREDTEVLGEPLSRVA
jgi:hypothetical protein